MSSWIIIKWNEDVRSSMKPGKLALNIRIFDMAHVRVLPFVIVAIIQHRRINNAVYET